MYPPHDASKCSHWEGLYVGWVGSPQQLKEIAKTPDGSQRIPVEPLSSILKAAPIVGLPLVDPSNLVEWLFRLSALEWSGLTFRSLSTREGEVPMPIRYQDLLRTRGLTVDVPALSDCAFFQKLRLIKTKQIRFHLDKEKS